MCINHFIFVSLLTIISIKVCCGEDLKLELLKHEDKVAGLTTVWRVPMLKIAKNPVWYVGQEEPPLSLGKATTIAKTWIVSKGCSTNSSLCEVVVRVYPASDQTLKHFCFYNLLFGDVGLVGHYRRCVVLMDGTVVEPELLGRIPKNLKNAYYDE